MLSEHGIKGLMQITIVEREQLTDALFERKPAVCNGVQIWGVGGQEFLGAARAFNELAGFGGLRETGVIIDHTLSWFEDRHQTVLEVRCKERGVAGTLEHQRRDQLLVVEGINQPHAVRAMARLLAPARFALGAPAVGTGFVIIPSRLLQLHPLLGGSLSQLRAKLFSQLFVPLGVAEGLFLCV